LSRFQCAYPPDEAEREEEHGERALQRAVLVVRVADPLPAEVRPPHVELAGERRLALGERRLAVLLAVDVRLEPRPGGLSKVQSKPILVVHAVGSPSLMAGSARPGWAGR
jgi:hypothetical protein